MIKTYGSNRIAVSIDVKNQKAYYNGWQTNAKKNVNKEIMDFINIGVKNFIITDISKDGMMNGIDIESFKELKILYPNINFLLAGGITTIDDLIKIKENNFDGGIIGKAYYEGNLNIEEVNKKSKIKNICLFRL